MSMDVCITAVRRPEILRRTLESFDEFLLNQYRKKRAIINVDPVGEDIDPRRVVDVCQEFFEEVVWNCPEEPSFPKAFKWVWTHANAQWLFHLEDDWEMLRPVNLSIIGDLLLKYRDLALLRLPAFHAGLEYMKTWNRFMPWNGEFYEVPSSDRIALGFCGHPQLIKGEFVRAIAPYIDENRNPEKQFHVGPKEIMQEVSRWRYGLYGEPADPPSLPIVRDIGRQWSVQHGWKKKGSKAWFTEWEVA